MARAGENVLAIGRLRGHANPHITLKYTHLAVNFDGEQVQLGWVLPVDGNS